MLLLERITPEYALIYDGDEPVKVSPQLVAGCHEGDVLIKTEHGYAVDEKATADRRRDILALQDSLWE